MIIELNGLSGCGKTTLKNVACSKHTVVRSVGVAEFRGEGRPFFYKLVLKLRRFIGQFTPANIGLYKDVRKMVRTANQREGAQFSNSYENAVTVMYTVYLFSTYRGSEDTTLIVDEGIVQSITSCCVQMEINRSDLEAVLQRFQRILEKIVVVNCDCTLEASFRRIQARNRNDSAMDQLTVGELQILLKRYQEQLTFIRSMIGNTCKQMVSLNVEDYDPKTVYVLEKKIGEFI